MRTIVIVAGMGYRGQPHGWRAAVLEMQRLFTAKRLDIIAHCAEKGHQVVKLRGLPCPWGTLGRSKPSTLLLFSAPGSG